MLSTYLQGFNGHKTPLQVKYLYPHIKGSLHHTVTFCRHTVRIGTQVMHKTFLTVVVRGLMAYTGLYVQVITRTLVYTFLL